MHRGGSINWWGSRAAAGWFSSGSSGITLGSELFEGYKNCEIIFVFIISLYSFRILLRKFSFED
jgi:hypothetical protein